MSPMQPEAQREGAAPIPRCKTCGEEFDDGECVSCKEKREAEDAECFGILYGLELD